ncbi:MAG: NAD(+)/NADH kinase [Thermoplasmata archaeon]
MKIGLTAHPRKPAAIALARRALEQIGDRAEVVLSDAAGPADPGRPHSPLEKMATDVLLAIGGDGTFLYTLRRSSLPLLPVNAGTVGVLAEVDARRPGEFDAAIERLLAGRYTLEERMKLAGQAGPTPLPDVVNEYVVHAARVGAMGSFEISFDRRVVGRVRADGLIVATPTGSTAYSLSSLGPIVAPAVEGLVLTAIAPFRAEARSLVVDPLATVGIRAVEGDGSAVVLVDGQDQYPLSEGETVIIHRSPRRATLVRFGVGFLERLRGKRILPWNEEFADRGGSFADLPPPA